MNKKRIHGVPWKNKTPEQKNKAIAKTGDWRRKRRRELIQLLGGRCACCGEDRLFFLTIDHVHGNGQEHRKKLNPAAIQDLVYHQLMAGNRTDYQCLCYNCNCAKGTGDRCPCGGQRRLETALIEETAETPTEGA